MKKQFETCNNLLNDFELSIQTFPPKDDETMDVYFQRLMAHIDKLKKTD